MRNRYSYKKYIDTLIISTNEMKRIINDADIEKITRLSFRNNTMGIKRLLIELPELKEDTLREDIRKLIRDNGRSNIISISEIENILD